MNKKVRSFLAILLPEELKKKIYQSLTPLRQLSLDVKWVEEENYHLTLKFLGSLTTEEIHKVDALMFGLAAKETPFYLKCGKLMLFPNQRRPRVISLSLEGDLQTLQVLQKKIDDKLTDTIFSTDKKIFRPHITLGRLRSLRNIRDLFKIMSDSEPLLDDKFKVNEFFLMASQLTPQGPHYTPLASFPL
jgi:2'-5' RNA ligase